MGPLRPEPAARLGRRAAIRLAAASLCVGAGSALAACARPGTRAAPTAASTVITLTLQALVEGGINHVRAPEETVLATFERANPGVQVKLTDPAGSDANVKTILAGHGPDVFWDYHYAPYLEKSALLRLDEFLSRDNINPDLWSAAQMKTLGTTNGTFALPCFFGTQVYAVNLSDFDQRHLAYPDPSWTYTDFVAVAHELAGTDSSGNRHYGASMEWYQDQTGDGEAHWLFGAFRGTYIDGDGLNLRIDEPEGIAAGEWMYEELLWPQTAQPRHPGQTAGEFAAGQMSMAAVGNWGLLSLVNAVKPSTKFDFYPFPIFPAGRTAFGTDDFYAIAASTKQPELAWQLLQFLSVQPDWQQAQIRLQLLSPSLNALWPEWITTVQQATPVLKGKAVHYFADAATGAYALPPQYFAVADTQAQGMIGSALSSIFNRQVHVDVGFKQLVQQVNPVVAAAAAKAAQQKASSTGAAGGSNAAFAPPPQRGIGNPATDAAGQVAVGGGGYTLTATGAAGVMSAADQCVYACLPMQSGGGTFTCRISALDAAGSAPPDAWAEAGLMVRGDLSDDATALVLAVTGNHGIVLQVRPQARLATTVSQPATPGDPAGLIGSAALAYPVWLRLTRGGLNWTAATSTDGQSWHAAGTQSQLALAGCWIGVFATSHNGKPVTAKFDNTDFDVTGAYAVGG